MIVRGPASDAIADNLALALAALAAQQPDHALLHLPGRPSLVYADLRAQIALVRDCLLEWCIAPGDIVAGRVDDRARMALACAALPVSATFAPLAPGLIDADCGALLDRLRPKAVLTGATGGRALADAARRRGIAHLRALPDPAAPFGRFRLERESAGDDRWRAAPIDAGFAFVLSTSGTTGRPKLVPVSHRQILAYAQVLGGWLGLGPADVGCCVSPFHLAGGLRATLLTPLLRGGSLVCLPEGDVDGIFGALDAYRPTWFGATFAIHRALLRRCPDHRDALARSRLRFLRVTAGLLEPDERERLAQAFRAPVVAGYGTTEVAGIAHDPLPPVPGRGDSVGIAMAGSIATLGEDGVLREGAGTGEILVRGPLVFTGYLDDPGLDARAFHDGWYRTGDHGTIDTAGFLTLHGRADEMINRGGEKIAPAAIDRVLEAVPGIVAAAAFGVPHRTLGAELVAAAVRAPAAKLAQREVLAHLRRILPPNRVPRRIVFVDALPRSAAGKVRRNALAEAYRAGADHDAGEDTPASATEVALAGLWSVAFPGRRLGRDDDFFLAGGDSLSGARLLAQVAEAFGVELPLDALFDEAATIAGMARAIRREVERKSRPPGEGAVEAPLAGNGSG